MRRLLIAAGLAVILAAVVIKINITTSNTWSGTWSIVVTAGSPLQNIQIAYSPAANGTFQPLIMPNIFGVQVWSLTGSLAFYINATECYSLNGGTLNVFVGSQRYWFNASSPLNYTIEYPNPYLTIIIKPITSSYYHIILQSNGFNQANSQIGFWMDCINATSYNPSAGVYYYLPLNALTLTIK